ncbi:MAG: hypothetical protein IJU46_00355 [Clostridia bacterium]|nr:hypothetical protein [Clostridia bacterium]
MAVLQEYKCPCCGGAIAFDSTLQKMKCPYCDTEFEMEALAGYDQILHSTEGSDNIQWHNDSYEWKDGETEGMRIYLCKSCGGEIIGDESMAATSCPFCGNPVIIMGQYAGELKPDYVIPFKLDKKAAKAAMLKHFSGKRLLPKVFKDQNHLDSIVGMYVPFWLFDTEASANISYRATRMRSWSDSRYVYTETSYYSVSRQGTLDFERVPVDGSKKMEDTLMESLEPYDYSQLTDFQTAYLAGYVADRYDVDSTQSVVRANERVKRSTEQAFASTVEGYSTVTPEKSVVNASEGKVKYALLPVWILNTTWNGQNYTFAMNGQTGRFVGDLPVDKKAYRRWLFGLMFGVAAGVFLLLWLFFKLTH